MDKVFKINPKDNVVVALEDVKQGETFTVDGAQVTAKQDITRGHKMAIRPIADGECVVKYGNPIGTANGRIEAGDWVHIQTSRRVWGICWNIRMSPASTICPK